MDINTLYRQVIMDHYKSPKNNELVNDDSYLTVHLNNPSCGDEIIVQLKLENNKIIDVKQSGSGCSICCASASVMSVTLKDKTKEEALNIIREFSNLVTGKEIDKNILTGDAIVFSGVAKFPARIRCASLAWQAAEKGLLSKE